MNQSLMTRPAQLPTDRNPAGVYLAGLSRTGRVTMLSALNVISEKLTGGRIVEARLFDWRVLRYQHIEALRSRLQADYAPATANKMICAVRGVMQQAWKLGYITSDEYSLIKSVAGVRGSTLPAGRDLSIAEIAAILRACTADGSKAGARDGAMIVLLCSGGLRRAEIGSILLSDYDQVNQTLLIRGKGNKQRNLPLIAVACAALADWLRVRGSRPGALFCPINKSGKVLVRSTCLSPQSVYNMVIKRAQQAGVKDISTHDFRRTFVGNLLDAGADISTAQKLVGHSSVTTTQRYDRRGEKTKRSAVELLSIPYEARKHE
jgi:integrase/recombinase XerD